MSNKCCLNDTGFVCEKDLLEFEDQRNRTEQFKKKKTELIFITKKGFY